MARAKPFAIQIGFLCGEKKPNGGQMGLKAGMALNQDNQDAHPNLRAYHPSGNFRQDDGTG